MPPKPTIEFIASPNFKARRRQGITAIVIHYTASMNLDGTIDWFRRRESGVSAHYVVGREGRIIQMVQDEMSAWHAGRSAMFPNHPDPKLREPDVNQFSLGIELVGDNDSGFTDRQLAALYELLSQLVVKYRIKPDRVVGHLHIAPGRKIDPDGYDKQFPWAKARAVCQQAYAALPSP